MKVEKRSNNSYRVRKMVDGRMITITFDHNPKKRELETAIADAVANRRVTNTTTFEKAAQEYINTRMLEHTTKYGYEHSLAQLSDEFKSLRIGEIRTPDAQREVKRMSEIYAPKTIKNAHGFISAVLNHYCPDTKLTTSLPKLYTDESYIPTDDDILAVSEFFEGTEELLPFKLMTLGMRRSEVFALTKEDLDDYNYLTINKALICVDKKWILKKPKTKDSIRKILLPNDVADMIRNCESIYPKSPNAFANQLRKAIAKKGLEHFSQHKLRHYFATKCADEGIPIMYVEQYGGWKRNSSVLQKIYTHRIHEKEKSMQENILKAMNF